MSSADIRKLITLLEQISENDFEPDISIDTDRKNIPNDKISPSPSGNVSPSPKKDVDPWRPGEDCSGRLGTVSYKILQRTDDVLDAHGFVLIFNYDRDISNSLMIHHNKYIFIGRLHNGTHISLICDTVLANPNGQCYFAKARGRNILDWYRINFNAVSADKFLTPVSNRIINQTDYKDIEDARKSLRIR
jgi:hypothetical protein